MGCKGSGRFLWLTVFNNIEIHSEISCENAVVDIDFDKFFNPDKVGVDNRIVEQNITILQFTNVTDRYYNLDKSIDFRVDADLDRICDSVKEYLLIKLFLLKNRNIAFRIKFVMDGREKLICNEDIPNLSHVDFKVPTEIGLLR